MKSFNRLLSVKIRSKRFVHLDGSRERSWSICACYRLLPIGLVCAAFFGLWIIGEFTRIRETFHLDIDLPLSLWLAPATGQFEKEDALLDAFWPEAINKLLGHQVLYTGFSTSRPFPRINYFPSSKFDIFSSPVEESETPRLLNLWPSFDG